MYPINTLKQSFLGVLTLKGPTLAWNNPFIALALMDPKMCTIFYPGTSKNIPQKYTLAVSTACHWEPGSLAKEVKWDAQGTNP